MEWWADRLKDHWLRFRLVRFPSFVMLTNGMGRIARRSRSEQLHRDVNVNGSWHANPSATLTCASRGDSSTSSE
jgi:hypothetical protein